MLRYAFFIFIILVILFMFRNFEQKTFEAFEQKNLEYYDFYGILPGPYLCLIAGTHGNEPAGTIALELLLKKIPEILNRGHIRVIPRINSWGLDNNIRYKDYFGILPDSDVNRNYTKSGGTEKISKNVIKLTYNADLVIDFHEGWGYHRCQPSSIGSTLTPTDFHPAPMISDAIVNILNEKLINCKKFLSLYNESCKIETTLACYMQNNKRPYILVETTGQNNIQPINIRVEQINNIVINAINMLKM